MTYYLRAYTLLLLIYLSGGSRNLAYLADQVAHHHCRLVWLHDRLDEAREVRARA